jgi:hypothetical protein
VGRESSVFGEIDPTAHLDQAILGEIDPVTPGDPGTSIMTAERVSPSLH